MGNLQVSEFSKKKDKIDYVHHLIQDLKALDYMVENDLIERTPVRIGAEQEFCLVDEYFMPVPNALEILEEVDDRHFTTEIGRYNLELNLDPLELNNSCFSRMHQSIRLFLDKANRTMEKYRWRIILTGILPSLRLRHISESYMTPIPRYFALNRAIKNSRKQDFWIHIKGVDELNLLHDSVMLEACNTSFQMHLQIDPNNFIEKYNWAQAIAGPVLSACVNSPLLFGRELWSETRIALFNQSTDTRANSFVLNERQARVSFGSDWEKGKVSNIFRNNISRHRSLLTSNFEEDSMDVLANSTIPKLKALNLHNGTVYRWNRPCYGVGNNKPHLRIECRYIPAGPTLIDQMANMAYWVGLMIGQPEKYRDIHEKEDFRNVRNNFYKAARTGMDAIFDWDDKKVTARDLHLQKLLPIARKGLEIAKISTKEIELYLGTIEKRIKSHNGAEWLVGSYRSLLKNRKPLEAQQVLTACLYENQQKDRAVSNWEVLPSNIPTNFPFQRIVKHHMNTNILSVDAEDSLELVIHLMLWNKIHHMPVIDDSKMIIGLLSWKDVENYLQSSEKQQLQVKDVMKTELIITTQDVSLERAVNVMKKHEIGCLPVVSKNKLIAILTRNDIPRS